MYNAYIYIFTVDKCEADSTKNGCDSDETLSAFSMDDSDPDATFFFATSDMRRIQMHLW